MFYLLFFNKPEARKQAPSGFSEAATRPPVCIFDYKEL